MTTRVLDHRGARAIVQSEGFNRRWFSVKIAGQRNPAMTRVERKVQRVPVFVRRVSKHVWNCFMVQGRDMPDLLKGIFDDLPVGF